MKATKNFIVVKVKLEQIKKCGSIFEASRGHWKVNMSRAEKCSHVIVAQTGCKVVKDVFKIDKWYPSTTLEGRYVFSGSPDEALRNKLVGRILNKKLTRQGEGCPTLYVKEDELLEIEE